jgi:CheY-like chemotaxis protein
MCLLAHAHAFSSSTMNLSSRLVSQPYCEALAAARSESPDLVISDVAMPGISGIDLAIQMRAQYPNCKILLFSGQAATLDLLESARAQGYDFRLLQKPVHPSEFLFEIEQLSTGLLEALPLVESLTPATA